MGVFSRIASWIAPRSYARAPSPRVVQHRPPRDTQRWPQWFSSGLTPERMSSITRQADQGYVADLMTLLQEIAGRDPLVSGLLSTRLSALSQRPVKCTASRADRDPARAEAVAEYCQEILDGLRLARPEGGGTKTEGGLSALVERLSMASYYGVAAGFVHWRQRDFSPRPVPVAVELFDERRFWVDIADQSLWLSSDSSSFRGTPLRDLGEPANLLELRNTRISRQLSMAGAGRAILWDWWLRFGSLKDFANYLETWGKPSLIGKTGKDVPGYGEDNLTNFKNLVEDFMGDTRSVLPPGFDLAILQAVAGGEKVFESLDKITERHIQFALVGETGTSSGEGGSLAKAEVNERVREDLIQGDSRLVSEALQGLLSHAVAWEFGAGVPVCEVEFDPGTNIDDLDAQARMMTNAASALRELRAAGLQVDPQEFAKRFDLPLMQAEAAPTGPPQV